MMSQPLYDVNIDFKDASREWRRNKIKLRHGMFTYRYIPPDKTVKRELFGVLVPGTDLYVVQGIFCGEAAKYPPFSGPLGSQLEFQGVAAADTPLPPCLPTLTPVPTPSFCSTASRVFNRFFSAWFSCFFKSKTV